MSTKRCIGRVVRVCKMSKRIDLASVKDESRQRKSFQRGRKAKTLFWREISNAREVDFGNMRRLENV